VRAGILAGQKMRLAAYGAISTSLATAVVLAAFQQRPNFYSACVYLSQSNACLMVLTNMGIYLTIILGFTVQKIFFGQLRAIEDAHLRERTWFAVTETFLAMTVFRDEFNTRFVIMFVSLLFVKCFHWICQDRIDYVSSNFVVALNIVDGAIPFDTLDIPSTDGVCNVGLFGCGCRIYQPYYRCHHPARRKYDDHVWL
jgi:hypothetical protein